MLEEEHAIKPGTNWEDIAFYRPIENELCSDGYSGRVTVAEVMPFSPAIAALVGKNAPQADIEKQARAEGMLTITENGLFLAAQGITTIEEVFRISNE